MVWGCFQLLLALISIYYNNRDRSRRDIEQEDDDDDEDGNEQHRNRPRHGFVADLQKGDVTFGYFVRKFLNQFVQRDKRSHMSSQLNRPFSPSSKQSTASSTSLMNAFKQEQQDKSLFH